jgi:type IV secretion system protein VirB10
MKRDARQLPSDDGDGQDYDQQDGALSPLPGELGIPNVAIAHPSAISKKGLLAVGLLVGSLIAASAVGIHRIANGGRKIDDNLPVRDKPAAAGAEPRRLDMSLADSPASRSAAPRIPAIAAMDDEPEPIGVRRTGGGAQGRVGAAPLSPEDAPILLVSARAAQTRPLAPVAQGDTVTSHLGSQEPGTTDPMVGSSQNLQAYQRQLTQLLDKLTGSAELAAGTAAASPASTPPPPLVRPGPAGGPQTAEASSGQREVPGTLHVAAAMLPNRSLMLPKGTAFTCSLKTRVISATSGLVGCQVQRNVFSDDGRVVLIERGSHLDGEYRIVGVRPGMVRIPVLWTRIRTPHGVTVDIESPATGKLGESGIDGYVDNRWPERIGAAMLLSMIDDSVKLVIQNRADEHQRDTVVLPSTTSNTSKLAEKVLDSTINIAPLIYQNQGGIVGIYVARDVDFSSVYELLPTTGALNRP